MNAMEYAYLAKLLKDKSALILEPGKEYLVDSRLLPVAKNLGLNSISELIYFLQQPENSYAIEEVIEAMVTTETFFFRDILPFESLKKTVIPELYRLRQKEKRLTIWCGAASSGQEPYSIAMLLHEQFPELRSWDIKILATDISVKMLERCKSGTYSTLEMSRGLTDELKKKYFTLQPDGQNWQISPAIRKMVEFQKFNLLQPFFAIPMCDLVFLRNVMIYFDVELKKIILSRIRNILKTDGYMILGSAETTFGIDDLFYRVDGLRYGFYKHGKQST